jgi:hypothetical protein
VKIDAEFLLAVAMLAGTEEQGEVLDNLAAYLVAV